MVSGVSFRQDMRRAKSGGYRTNSGPNGASDYTNHNEETPLLSGTYGRSSQTEGWLNSSLILMTVKVLGTSSLHLLLPLLPFALLARLLGWPPIVQFVLGFLSIIPLCSIIELAMEEMSMKIGQTLGGLLSATFGNTVEIVFSIIALKNDHIALVQASLLGDIFSNNLLNIGCCFLAGGLWHREQYFNMSFMSVMSFIMVVASITIVVPTIIHFIVEHGSASNDIQDSTGLAHGSALVLLMAYFAYLTFQLRTHSDLFDDENCDIDVMAEEEEEMSILPMWAAASVLVLGVTLMSLCTQNIVTNIDIFAEQIHSSKRFVGFIIIPFLSNTVNTRTAVNVALVDKMDLAVTVAMGSSLQILLFIVPLLVLVAWMMGQSLTLSFGILEAVLLLLSSFVAISILEKGRSTYLDGVLCLALYVIVAMSMFVYASDTML